MGKSGIPAGRRKWFLEFLKEKKQLSRKRRIELSLKFLIVLRMVKGVGSRPFLNKVGWQNFIKNQSFFPHYIPDCAILLHEGSYNAGSTLLFKLIYSPLKRKNMTSSIIAAVGCYSRIADHFSQATRAP